MINRPVLSSNYKSTKTLIQLIATKIAMTFAGSIPVGELLPPSEVFPKVEVDGVVVPVVRGSSEPTSIIIIIIIIITIIIIIIIIMVSSEALVNLQHQKGGGDLDISPS